MHELGIVMHLIRQVEDVARENDVQAVQKIVLEVGEVSGIVPDLFCDAYEWAKKRTDYLQEAELEMIILEGLTYCKDCEKTYRTTEHGRKCPYCGSYDTYLVTGDEITIKEIQVT